MFLFRVRNTYSVIALCREEIDECEGGERELFLAGKREEKVRATSPPSQSPKTRDNLYFLEQAGRQAGQDERKMEPNTVETTL